MVSAGMRETIKFLVKYKMVRCLNLEQNIEVMLPFLFPVGY